MQGVCREGAGLQRAAERVQDFNAQELANTLWAMAKAGMVLPDAFECLCKAFAEKVQDRNKQHLASSLWSMAKAGVHLAEAHEASFAAMAKTPPSSSVHLGT